MAHDFRYNHVKSIWTAGDLKSFNQIFTIIPRYIISDDLGVNYGRFAKKIDDPLLLSMKEIIQISDLTNVDFRGMVDLVLTDIEASPQYQIQYPSTTSDPLHDSPEQRTRD